MRKLVLQMQVSVDGFVGGPNGEIDWIFGNIDEGAQHWIVNHIWLAGLHIMGSRTFHDMAAHWPTSTEPYAAPMNEIPKAVFSKKGLDSSTVTRALADAATARQARGEKPSATPAPSATTWTQASVLSDLVTEIRRLKQEPGREILAHGGASFAQNLVTSGLIDEYRLLVHPVALGRGLPLFAGLPKPVPLRLLSATTFNAGVVAHVYRPT